MSVPSYARPYLMPVADSLADAETLRLGFYTLDLCLAAGHGGRAAQLLTHFQRSPFAGLLEPGYAIAAARYAFCACPELRVPDFESEEDAHHAMNGDGAP